MSTQAAASLSEAIRSRVKSTWPQQYRDLINNALSSFDALRTKRSEVSSDKDLSTEGKAKRVRDYVFNEVGQNLAMATRIVHRLRKNLASERKAAISKATAGDLDAVALAICAAVRNLPQADIARLTIGADADQRVVQAVLSAPPLLTGVSAELRGQIEADFTSRHAAADMGKVAECEEALEAVETCVTVLKNEIIEALGMTPHAFDAWFGREFAPSDAQLRAEDGEFAAREKDNVLEAAACLPLRQRIQLVDSLLERNTAEVRKTA